MGVLSLLLSIVIIMRFPTSTTLLVATAMIMPFVGTVEAFGVTNTATTQVPVRINSSISFVTTPNYHHMHNHARRHRSSATGPLSMASGPEDIVAAEGVLASLPLFLVPAAAALVGGSGLAQKRALQTDAALVEKQIEGIKQRLSNTDVQITVSASQM